MDLNQRSHFLVNKRTVEGMISQHKVNGVRRRINNMASQLAVTATADHLNYAVAKAAVAHLTCQLAVDYARQAVLVNALVTGRIITSYNPGETEYLNKGVWREDALVSGVWR
jgi:NAD(P)-dependent dehydrogenase (short-subunit alcohol dehydrogenase family)